MSEFLQSYWFFILVAVLMLACHLGHGGHGGRRRGDGDKEQGDDAHRH